MAGWPTSAPRRRRWRASLGAATGRGVEGIVVAADPAAAATDLATYLPVVRTVTEPTAAEHAWSAVAAGRLAGLLATETPDAIFVGAGADGRDLAGALSALTGLGVLVNATAVTWGDGGPVVDMSVFGGKLTTTSGFTAGRGIITVRPNVTTAVPAASAGPGGGRGRRRRLATPRGPRHRPRQ